jgi:hypothetical protein
VTPALIIVVDYLRENSRKVLAIDDSDQRSELDWIAATRRGEGA